MCAELLRRRVHLSPFWRSLHHDREWPRRAASPDVYRTSL